MPSPPYANSAAFSNTQGGRVAGAAALLDPHRQAAAAPRHHHSHGPRRGDESALIADLLVDAALLGVV
jgi:hypothetical protein